MVSCANDGDQHWSISLNPGRFVCFLEAAEIRVHVSLNGDLRILEVGASENSHTT